MTTLFNLGMYVPFLNAATSLNNSIIIIKLKHYRRLPFFYSLSSTSEHSVSIHPVQTIQPNTNITAQKQKKKKLNKENNTEYGEQKMYITFLPLRSQANYNENWMKEMKEGEVPFVAKLKSTNYNERENVCWTSPNVFFLVIPGATCSLKGAGGLLLLCFYDKSPWFATGKLAAGSPRHRILLKM